MFIPISKTRDRVPDETLARIEERMREITAADLPFIRRELNKEEAVQLLSKGDHEEKIKMLARASQVDTVPIYFCDGFYNFFYGSMTPSSGYVKIFELRRYRNGVLLRYPSRTEPDRIPVFQDDRLLYQAFGEAKKWGNLMDINYVGELNQKIETGDYREIIQVSEALHEKKDRADRRSYTKSRKTHRFDLRSQFIRENIICEAALHSTDGQRTKTPLSGNRRLLR